MPPTVKCPKCGKSLAVPAGAAGKVGKCGACGTKIAFPPEPPPAVEDTAMERFRASLVQRRDAAQREEASPRRRSLFSSLAPCRHCSREVSRSAKFCPGCGCRNPAPPEVFALAIVAIVLLPVVLVGGCVFLSIVGDEHSGPATVEPSWTADLSPAKQAERKQMIEQLIQQGAFLKVVKPARLPHVWVTPSFLALDYDTKKDFISIVFLYYQPVDMVVLKDSLTGQRIGNYSPELGLRLD